MFSISTSKACFWTILSLVYQIHILFPKDLFQYSSSISACVSQVVYFHDILKFNLINYCNILKCLQQFLLHYCNYGEYCPLYEIQLLISIMTTNILKNELESTSEMSYILTFYCLDLIPHP